MNGVRRFLTGGTSTPTTQQFPEITPPPALPQDIPVPESAKPSWPPSPLQSPTDSMSPATSPKTTTAALFFRKDKQRPLVQQSSSSSSMTRRADEDVPNGDASFQSSRHSGALVSPARSQSSSLQLSSPVAGPSSPRAVPNRVSELSRKPVDQTNGNSKRASGVYSARDDMLFSLLASEAVVDSRNCEILSAEEVEELKKEHQVLASRLVAMTKKLSLETKIRDAALSLSKANASYRNVSKQTSEQLDSANRKVELAQRELWRVSERASEVQRKLLEHRAGVLSYSVRSLERKAAPEASESSASGYSTPNRSSQLSRAPSSVTSVQTASSKGRFEGAHFFAGHSDAVVPQLPRAPPTIAEVAVLEEKLQAVTAELKAVSSKQAQAARDLSMLRLEKEQVETSLAMDLQAAEDTIAALELEIGRMEDIDAQLRSLETEKEAWGQERIELDERRREVDTLERRLEVLEEQSGEAAEIGAILAAEKQERRLAIEAKEREIAELEAQWSSDRAAWDVEKRTLMDGGESKTQLADLSDAMRDLMQTHGILLASRDASPLGLVSSVDKHLEDLHVKLDASVRAQEELSVVRTKLEEDARAGLDKQQALLVEIDEARRARDDAKAQVRDMEVQLQLKEQSFAELAATSLQASNQGPVEYTGDAAKVVAVLRPLWSVLPSPEARASRLGKRNFRPASPGGSPSTRTNASLSEMDVRSLKNLYDLRGSPMPVVSGSFTVEAFAARVQALVADDRALIERLIRFAQAHDLLKKNAERAQKLAQNSNVALETYQKQVNMLEDRNMSLLAQQATLQEDVQHLQEAIDRIVAQKLDAETKAAEQAVTCRQLTDANNTLSARALSLASDAASESDSVRQQKDAQLAEVKAALARAEEQIENIRSSQQMQQMALLEELNTMQTENANLRAQLRKK